MLVLHPYSQWALQSYSLAANHCWGSIWSFSLVPLMFLQQAISFPFFFILPHDGFIFNMLLFVVLCLTCPCLFSGFSSLPGHELHPLKPSCSLLVPPSLFYVISFFLLFLWMFYLFCFPGLLQNFLRVCGQTAFLWAFGTTFTYILPFRYWWESSNTVFLVSKRQCI